MPTNGNIFFTIFQTFETESNGVPNFGEYPKDFFDLIIVDECHRGGANDEGNWRGILEYFSPAVQLGLTATPKRNDNADTYAYFGNPLYIYSLKEGINDGFLTPFRVRKYQTSIDSYTFVSDDTVVEGEVVVGKHYEEFDFNKIIVIREREEYRVELLLAQLNQNEKTIIFCATQAHALMIRDIINERKISQNSTYCVRVTADEGSIGDHYDPLIQLLSSNRLLVVELDCMRVRISLLFMTLWMHLIIFTIPNGMANPLSRHPNLNHPLRMKIRRDIPSLLCVQKLRKKKS